MPCNAKVVLTAKVKVSDIGKLNTARLVKLTNGYYQLNSLVSLEVDPKSGNATLRYTGLDWDEGVKMLSNAVTYIKKLNIEVSDVGKPETHRHDDPQTHVHTGVTH